MKLLNKIIAFLLLMAVAVGALASCDTPNGPLQSDTYVANVEVKFSSENAEIKAVVDAMNRNSTIYVSEGDMKIETSVQMDGISITDKYVLFGGTLYHESRATVNGKTAVELKKTSMSDDNRQQLIAEVGAGASIEPTDFNIQEQDGDELNYTYNCSRITGKAKESLEAIYGANFSAIGATVELSGAEYTLVAENGRTTSSSLTCHFVIGLNGQSYEITAEIITKYDYDATFGISTPANSSSYQLVSYGELFD